LARSAAAEGAGRLEDRPRRPPQTEKSGQLEGTLAHCAILEPDEFSKRYVAVPKDAPRRPTESQWNAKKPSLESVQAMDWWREFGDRTGGATVIGRDQYEVAMRQAESVRKLPEVAELLADCATEVSAFWTDGETGAHCRCRPDLVHPAGSGVILADVKTYSDASPGEFRRQIARKLYHLQDAFYSDGFEAATGKTVHAFIFIAVETVWPFAACALMLDDSSRQKGREIARAQINRYAECDRTGIWPGYSDRIELVTLPAWAQ
jgi:hypothetical protein